jgi:Xaa-Pro aminopeptidase
VGSERRCSVVRERLEDAAEAFIVGAPVNVRYLTEFWGVFDEEAASFAVLVPGGQWVVTDSRYAEAARRAAEGTPWQVAVATSDVAETTAQVLREAGVQRVAIETSLEHRRWRHFVDVLEADVVEADGWVEAVRAVKESGEIRRIESAQELTDLAFEHILRVLRSGIAEAKIALELELFLRRNGGEGVAFAPIVASGPNSALPHAPVTSRVLRDGDFVVLDFGARAEGYCADMTRTVVVGHATTRHREVYEAVLAANLAGLSAIRAGATGRQVDSAGREIIEAAGFGECFGHGLGHGVGLEVHEAPGVGPRSDEELPAGAVVTIEPGVYIPEFGGARIEDLVVVEESGARVLTRSAKDLIEVQ